MTTASSAVTNADMRRAPITLQSPRDGLNPQQVLTLYGRLTASIWTVDDRDEPLALCFCALVLLLDPFADIRRIANCLPHNGDRFALTDFHNALATFGYRASGIALQGGTLDPRVGPALVLAGRGATDPMILWTWREDGQLRGAAYCGATMAIRPWIGQAHDKACVFVRIDEARLPHAPVARRASGIGWFRAVFTRFTPQLRKIFAIGLLLQLLSLSVPIFALMTYNRILTSNEIRPLAYLSVGLLLVVLAEYLLRRLRSGVLAWMTTRIDYLVGVAIFEHLLRLPAALVQTASVSDQVARVKTFESVRDFFCGPVLMTTLELPAAAMSLVLLTILTGPLVTVPLVAIALFGVLFWLIWRLVRIRIYKAAIEASAMQRFTLDAFSKIDSLHLDGLVDRWVANYRQLSGQDVWAGMRLQLVGAAGELLAQLLTGLSAIALLVVGTHQIWAGEMGAGHLVAALMLLWRILGPFQSLCGMVPRVEQVRNALRQIDELMELPTEAAFEKGSMSSRRLRGQVAVTQLAVRYDRASAPAVVGLNFSLAAGQVCALTGPTGAGKSTVLKALLGVQPLAAGAIHFDGFDIRQLDPRELREQMSYVPEQIDIFDGTLADNLRLGAPMSNDDALRDALHRINALSMLDRLPDGLRTRLTRDGPLMRDQLLRQQIGLARALLKPARILLIDEQPSAALLQGLDASLSHLLANNRGQTSIIFVTHRTDFLRQADVIVGLRIGRPPIVGDLDTVARLL